MLCLISLGIGGCNRSTSGSHSDIERTANPQPSPEHPELEAKQHDADAETLRLVLSAMSSGDFETANEGARALLLVRPDDADLLELAADIAVQRKDFAQSAEMYQSAIEKSETPSFGLFNKLTESWVRQGRVFSAISTLHKSIDLFPNETQPRFDLVGLTAMLGVPQDATLSLRWLAQHNHGDPESLLVLADPGRVRPDVEIAEKWLELSGNDRRVEFALAKENANTQQWQSALSYLEPLIEKYPSFVFGHVLYAQALLELGQFKRLDAWKQVAPIEIQSNPEFWIVVGKLAQHYQQHEEASYAFWKALSIDENSYAIALTPLMFNLSQLQGFDKEKKFISEQIVLYSRLRDAVDTHIARNQKSQKAAMEIADTMLELGRVWEAEAWARLAATLREERIENLRERYLKIRSQLSADSPWQRSERSVAEQVNLSAFSRWSWSVPSRSSPSLDSSTNKKPALAIQEGEVRDSDATELHPFVFEDEASARGLIHTCKIASTRPEDGHKLHHGMGGGASVIDYDLDGWPDVIATMLNGTAMERDSSANRLFRNVGGNFVDRTSSLDKVDNGFSQGIAVGDFNGDGFPDLFDANIGKNRLYRNNGDGTLSDVTAQSGILGEYWTTSAAIVDLDGDGNADIFSSNYCSGSEAFKMRCTNSSGEVPCQPLQFPAQDDVVWRGKGDGSFENVTDQWLEQTSSGRGLGLVVGMLDEYPGMDVYVANDMSANHLWSAFSKNNLFRMKDIGVIRGLGLNDRSLSQASMGIAVDDPDHDGDFDLFVTQFSSDHNTYYEHVASGMWQDRTFQVGLHAPSYNFLGFGTQFCDFDNDGTLELIVSNGHVQIPDRNDLSFAMRPQLFIRNPQGKWDEVDRRSLGGYFEVDHVGRALAKIDVNRDRKSDVLITHLYEPLALLVNQSKNSHRAATLVLKATRSHRDAIGAIVSCTIGKQNRYAQLTAGDGFMTSNERNIKFGTDSFQELSDVTIAWPSGHTESFGNLPTGHEYLLIEGTGHGFSIDALPIQTDLQ